MHPLHNKVALITGASSGIGQATALRLGGFGCRIAVLARNAAALQDVVRKAQALNTQALALPTDVTDAEQVRQAVATTVDHFGRLDILLCSAGVSMRAYFAGCDLTALERVMRVNFFGTLYATYYALPHIRKSRGSLVAVSSLTGLRGIPSYSVYGASKFAVIGLYDSLRLELLREGVHVGWVAPGFVDTPLRDKVLGPDGQPWATPPQPPFRVWPVDTCVNRIVRLIVRRRKQALLPAFIGPLFWLDQILLSKIGDAVLRYAFPPEKSSGKMT